MELYGTLAGTTNLIDAVGNAVVLNISLVGSIVEDERVVMQGVVHPFA